MRALSGLSAALLGPLSPALGFAHGAHPNELDGHSHWIALAALAAVGVTAFLAARSMESGKAPKKPDAASDALEG